MGITFHIMYCSAIYYPHMPISKVWIYGLLFVCFCLYAYGFLRQILHADSGVSWAESLPFWKTLLPEAQNRTNRRAAGGHRIGMCG